MTATKSNPESAPDYPDMESWAWQMMLEEQLDREAELRDAASPRRHRIVWQMRVIAVVVVLAGLVGVSRLVDTYGLGLGLLGAWALPMFVLGVMLAVEKLLLRLTH
ncbi:MAG TPA: hypothetical protein VGQ20_08350 [Acidimicrobiales bacterium]|jgi:hypothetical protein|nr:hypothetical protein [Acidimicrobiales bacterium]